MIVKVNIPESIIIELLANGSQMRNKYQTNRRLQLYSVLLLLKSQTKSGVLHYLSTQIKDLSKYCKISRSNLYTKINELESEGLVTKSGNKLILSSWNTICEKLHTVYSSKEVITIKYDTANKDQTLPYLIRGLEIAVNNTWQVYGFAKKITQNPHTKDNVFMVANQPYSLSSHEKAIRRTFEKGAPKHISDSIHQSNPIVGRNSASIRIAQGYRSRLQATYLKRQLELRGIAIVHEGKKYNVRFSEENMKSLPEGYKIGRCPTHSFHRVYRSEQKTASIRMPDRIILTDGLFENITGSNTAPITFKIQKNNR